VRLPRCFPLDRAPADHDAGVGQRLANAVEGVALCAEPPDLVAEPPRLARALTWWLLRLKSGGRRGLFRAAGDDILDALAARLVRVRFTWIHF
jgi:hypothetical protein